MFKISPTFWKDVEDPNKTEYVIYGDSIAENEKVLIGFKNCNNYELKLISFKETWNILSKQIEPVFKNDKEYLYIKNEVKVATFSDKTDRYKAVFPLYLVRHHIKKNICKLNFENYSSISVTHDHSLLTIDEDDAFGDRLISVKPKNADYVAIVNNYYTNLIPIYKLKHNIDNWRNTLTNVALINIKSKTDIFYSGYVYDFSVPKTENFIVNGFVVHNTDSIHIHSPNEIYTSSKEATDKAELLANEINGVITNLLNNHLLVKMNVNRDYNKTFFKTESVISKMILLGAKKNYAYLEISKKGKIHESPKVKYVGIPVVRSDYSKFTQDFIKFLVEKIAFNSEIYGQNISDIIISVINDKKQELENKLKNFDYKYIATPGRWKVSNSYSSTPFTVIGMQLYNTVTNTETFRPGLNGLSFPIKVIDIEKFKESIKPLKASKYFLKNVPLSKINYITLPTNYEIDIVTKIFNNCSIKIDEDIVWDKSFGTVAKNIARVINNHFSNRS